MRLIANLTLALLVTTTAPACDDRRDVGHERERERRAASNLCSDDAQCYVTGCHKTLCRAALTETFCEHRLKLTWTTPARPDDADALATSLRTFIEPLLANDERAALTVAAHTKGILTTFHTHPDNRDRIQRRLDALQRAGLYLPSPEAERHAKAALDAAEPSFRGRFRMRRAQGITGALLETDVDTDGPEAASQHLRALLGPHTPPNHRWAFEHLPADTPSSLPVVRAWLVPDTPEIALLDTTATLDDDGDTLSLNVTTPDATQHLAELTRSRALDHTLIALHNDTVLAAPRVTAPITDGHIRLSLAHTAPMFREGLEQLLHLPPLAAALRFDAEATRAAEADIACYSQEPLPATCGCVEGTCQWQMEPELERCLGL